MVNKQANLAQSAGNPVWRVNDVEPDENGEFSWNLGEFQEAIAYFAPGDEDWNFERASETEHVNQRKSRILEVRSNSTYRIKPALDMGAAGGGERTAQVEKERFIEYQMAVKMGDRWQWIEGENSPPRIIIRR